MGSLASKCELKKTQASKVVDALAEVAAVELKKAGVFTIPGCCRVKTRLKPATKAGNFRENDGCQGKAGQDCREGIRCRRTEKALLRDVVFSLVISWPSVGISWGQPATGTSS